MNFTQALQVLRSGGTIERDGRSYIANRDESDRHIGGILDVSDPEEPVAHKWSEEDRAAEDWQDPSAPEPQVVAPETVDEALSETNPDDT